MKWKERISLAIFICLVMFAAVLVLDIQMSRATSHGSGRFVPMHGRVQHKSFQRRYLQKIQSGQIVNNSSERMELGKSVQKNNDADEHHDETNQLPNPLPDVAAIRKSLNAQIRTKLVKPENEEYFRRRDSFQVLLDFADEAEILGQAKKKKKRRDPTLGAVLGYEMK
ncbi:hypothetical protein QYM36_008999 [Artemia franciscana]|uniref:Uncharacterized protein n=1 Tax=Artemia franciscana TaxID=6661 RepID=A0AA88L6N1_ARTSF|nr:hypothetical protein QYM36_008999 [Artemia franciscana]